MSLALVSIVSLFVLAAVVIRGHSRAVALSEASLQAQYKAEGPNSAISANLMREAGYNV